MRHFLLINAAIAAFLLSGCSTKTQNSSSVLTSNESELTSSESESIPEEEEEEKGVIDHISLDKRYLDLVKGKSYTSPGLIVSFFS